MCYKIETNNAVQNALLRRNDVYDVTNFNQKRFLHVTTLQMFANETFSHLRERLRFTVDACRGTI